MRKNLRKGVVLFIALAMIAAVSATVWAADTAKININTASKEQLMELDQIGDIKAAAIIAYRSVTPFKSAEDIMQVKGIGEKIFKTNKDRITVSDAQTAAKPSKEVKKQ